MHKAVGVVLWVVGNADMATHGYGSRKALTPKRLVDGNIAERQHTNGDAAHLIMAYSDKIARTGDHANRLALLNAGVGMVDGTRENPRMEAQKRLLLTSFQLYAFVHGQLLFFFLF